MLMRKTAHTLSVTVGSPEKSSPSFINIRLIGGNSTLISRKASASVITYAYDGASPGNVPLKEQCCYTVGIQS
jgi:hypothetical protein